MPRLLHPAPPPNRPHELLNTPALWSLFGHPVGWDHRGPRASNLSRGPLKPKLGQLLGVPPDRSTYVPSELSQLPLHRPGPAQSVPQGTGTHGTTTLRELRYRNKRPGHRGAAPRSADQQDTTGTQPPAGMCQHPLCPLPHCELQRTHENRAAFKSTA